MLSSQLTVVCSELSPAYSPEYLGDEGKSELVVERDEPRSASRRGERMEGGEGGEEEEGVQRAGRRRRAMNMSAMAGCEMAETLLSAYTSQ